MEDHLHEFYISPPSTFTNLFGNWLNGVTKKDKGLVRVGVFVLLWAIWFIRNDVIFNKRSNYLFSRFYLLLTGPICGLILIRKRWAIFR